MREISLHILDIVENGVTAGADCIHIIVNEARIEDRLEIAIKDNGRGIPGHKLEKLTDPFVTSRTTRRVGLGLPLLAAAAERCDGRMTVATEPGKGTEVTAIFRFSHIDRAPLGDMAATITTLIMGNPTVDFVYTHVINGKEFILDTREIKSEMEHLSLADPVVLRYLTESIRDSLRGLESVNSESQERNEKNGKADNR